jgi:hypothetical protein
MKLLGWLNGGFKLVDAKDARLVQGLRGWNITAGNCEWKNPWTSDVRYDHVKRQHARDTEHGFDVSLLVCTCIKMILCIIICKTWRIRAEFFIINDVVADRNRSSYTQKQSMTMTRRCIRKTPMSRYPKLREGLASWWYLLVWGCAWRWDGISSCHLRFECFDAACVLNRQFQRSPENEMLGTVEKNWGERCI